MSINNDHPDYLRFIKNEFKTIEFLKDQPYLAADINGLNIAAYEFYSMYGKRMNDNKIASKFNLNFETKFKLLIESEIRQVFIGANVSSNFSHVSYMLAFCESGDENSKVIRKYHFDYETNVGDIKKPIYHLQYGGKPSPIMVSLNLENENIQPWLSIPRINFTPINLALLLDLTFVEFKSTITQSIIERREWRELIKTNEEFMLKNYYNSISNFFNRGTHNPKTLFRDFSYGK